MTVGRSGGVGKSDHSSRRRGSREGEVVDRRGEAGVVGRAAGWKRRLGSGQERGRDLGRWRMTHGRMRAETMVTFHAWLRKRRR